MKNSPATVTESPIASSRRELLWLAGWASALPLVAACRAAATPTDASTSPTSEGAAPAMNANDAWKLSADDATLRVEKTEEEWKRLLTQEQFYVARKMGTERAFTGEYWNNHEKGIYRCIGCGLNLFSSDTKYESGTGWPSFWQPIAADRIATEVDRSLFSVRTEVHCPRCGTHLGHVFPDGPKPTGLRYCLNSAALKFERED